jgi:hypothetical protein
LAEDLEETPVGTRINFVANGALGLYDIKANDAKDASKTSPE